MLAAACVELRGDVLDDLAWNVTEISEERTDEADGRQLQCEAQPVVIATTTTDETQIVVVEDEEALRLQPRWRAGEPAIRAGLGTGEELDQHAGQAVSAYQIAAACPALWQGRPDLVTQALVLLERDGLVLVAAGSTCAWKITASGRLMLAPRRRPGTRAAGHRRGPHPR